jgi:hypothetical protein
MLISVKSDSLRTTLYIFFVGCGIGLSFSSKFSFSSASRFRNSVASTPIVDIPVVTPSILSGNREIASSHALTRPRDKQTAEVCFLLGGRGSSHTQPIFFCRGRGIQTREVYIQRDVYFAMHCLHVFLCCPAFLDFLPYTGKSSKGRRSRP